MHPRSAASVALLSLAAFAALSCTAESPRMRTNPGPFVMADSEPDGELLARARGIHDRVMTLDTHVDINALDFNPEYNLNYAAGTDNQVDIPKMEEGGLDAAFLVVYVGQNDSLNAWGYQRAYDQAMAKFHAVHRLVDTLAPARVGLALTPDDARRFSSEGKKVVFIGIENGFPVGTDITRVKEFADLGGRYMSLAHNGHSQLSDSNTGEREGWMHNGLSELGRQVIAEMNKWGIMIDVSHPSKQSMMQTLELTQAPIIGSHSAARALCNHSRNMDDEQLQALQKNGGVIQVVAFPSYVKCNPAADSARTAELAALREEFGIVLPARGGGGGGRGGRAGGGGGGGGGGRAARGGGGGGAGAARAGGGGGGGGGRAGRGGRGGNNAIQAQLDSMPEERRTQYLQRETAINEKYPPVGRADVADFVDHIDYVVNLIGINHVGISSDFDGGGGVTGWNNATETFNVTLELVRRGYTEAEIAKIWSGNLLRVLGEVQAVAARLQAGQ